MLILKKKDDRCTCESFPYFKSFGILNDHLFVSMCLSMAQLRLSRCCPDNQLTYCILHQSLLKGWVELPWRCYLPSYSIKVRSWYIRVGNFYRLSVFVLLATYFTANLFLKVATKACVKKLLSETVKKIYNLLPPSHPHPQQNTTATLFIIVQ